MNRRVRTRTHGGVGGREGRPSLPPDLTPEPYPHQVLREIIYAEYFGLNATRR